MNISLLWANPPAHRNIGALELDSFSNLRIHEATDRMGEGVEEKLDEQQLIALSRTGAEDIRLRQGILKDFIDNGLSPVLQRTVKEISQLRECAKPAPLSPLMRGDTVYTPNKNYLLLKKYYGIVSTLSESLKSSSLASDGLRGLLRELEEISRKQKLDRLGVCLKEIDAYWKPVHGVVLGMNLGPGLSPQAATLKEILTGTDGYEPLSPHKDLTGADRLSASGEVHTLNYKCFGILESWLHNMISGAKSQEIRKLKHDIAPFEGLDFTWLYELREQLLVYLYGCNWHQILTQSGWAHCLPEISESGALSLEGFCSPSIALKKGNRAVANDLSTEPDETVAVITGANSSGKTTLLRAIGANRFLFQLGFHVIAASACIPVANGIYTLFAGSENDDNSRFADEVRVTEQIRTAVQPGSLVLLNEPYTSTNPQEAQALIVRLIGELRERGACCICVTHFYGLQASCTEKGITAASFVMEAEQGESLSDFHFTYKLRKEQTRGYSLAENVAARLGFTAGNITSLLLEHNSLSAADLDELRQYISR